MAANKNFSAKWDLEEANIMRKALQIRLDYLTLHLGELTEDEKQEAGRIDTMLRRDF